MTGAVFTVTGQALNPDTMAPAQVRIHDIAHSLANQCRYNGATSRFYSVAEHSVHVSQSVPREHALTALLHDATEAYMGDLPVPLKEQLPSFTAMERRLWPVIAERFGLPSTLPPAVELVDKRIVANEMAELLPQCDITLPAPYDDPLPDVVIHGDPPETAREMFLVQFRLLTRHRLLEDTDLRPQVEPS